MHRVDAPGHLNNMFTDGNPVTGQQATDLRAKWLNDIQENVCHVIEQEGIELSEGDATQLRAAIVSLIAGVVGDGDGAVPTTRLINTTGLLTGGSDLASNLNLSVPKASAGEVLAGVNDTKAITPLALAGGMGGQLLAATGYFTIFGKMFQFGATSVNGNSYKTITLPTTFPTMCVHANCSGGVAATDAQDNNPYVHSLSASTITVFSARDEAVGISWMAIGW